MQFWRKLFERIGKKNHMRHLPKFKKWLKNKNFNYFIHFAALTKRINIGSIHLANNFRHPALVAKYFSTLSHISNGRIILFYDYAWRESEFRQTGISFEKTNKRVSRMIEGLNIIKKSFKEKKINFRGKYYKIKNFICNPKPLKKIPIWLGESDNKLMVKEIVKNADVFNSMPCSLNVFKKKLEIIRKECRKNRIDYFQIFTDEMLDKVLSGYLIKRNRLS